MGTYIPNGPTLSEDVGFVYKGRELPNPISYQNLFDIIFYDSQILITTNKLYVEKGVKSKIDITMEIKGITLVDSVELYLNDELYGEYDFDSEFVDGKLTITNVEIGDDTEIKMVVLYTSEDTKDVKTNVYAVAPSYVGLLPRWLQPYNITYTILQELIDGSLVNIENFDLPIYGDSINNQKLIKPIVPGNIEIHNEFLYNGLSRCPFIMYPSHPHPVVGTTAQLYAMTAGAQEFPSVDNVSNVSIELPDKTMEVYTVFVYSPAVTSLDTDITYKFK
jgi:hypothetical protein